MIDHPDRGCTLTAHESALVGAGISAFLEAYDAARASFPTMPELEDRPTLARVSARLTSFGRDVAPAEDEAAARV